MSEPNKITLTHPQSDPVDIVFDPLSVRDGKWVERLVLLPWATPHRLVGFIHPNAEKDLGEKPIMLQACFYYMASVGMQPKTASAGGITIAEGPKVIIPVDMIAPLDIMVGRNCPSWSFIRDQDVTWQKLFSSLILNLLMPAKVLEPGVGGLITP